jgi:hypothetical protein
MEGTVHSILRILTLLSLLATIGSFIIDAVPLIRGGRSHTRSEAATGQAPHELVDSAGRNGGSDPRDGAIKCCVATIVVCGAGIVAVRLIRMRGPEK